MKKPIQPFNKQPIIFIAGATGAIGYKLCLILKQKDYVVYGMTRSIEKAQFLEAIGIIPVIADIFNDQQIKEIIEKIAPNVVIHQLTDLPYGLNPALMEQARLNNARIRKLGTRHLLQALSKLQCRFIAQSIAFAYVPYQPFYDESSALDLNSSHPVLKLNAEGIYALEQQVMQSDVDAVILRYGKLYGNATGCLAAESCRIHVDAAAYAAYLAIENGQGIYQVVEDDLIYRNIKAKQELGFNPDYRFKL